MEDIIQTYRISTPESHGAFLVKSFSEIRSQLCDINIKVDNKTIPAHKFILSAASPFFRNMFASIFEESKKSDVQLTKDFEPDSVERIVEYIYSGEIKCKSTEFLQVYKDFDFFQLDLAKAELFNIIIKNLNTENAIETWQQFVKLKSTRDAVISFVSKNLPEISWHNKFLSLTFEKLLLSDLVDNFEPNLQDTFSDRFYDALMAWTLNDLVQREEQLQNLLPVLNAKYFSQTLIENMKKEKMIINNLECSNWCLNAIFSYAEHNFSEKNNQQKILNIMANGNVVTYDTETNKIQNTRLDLIDLENFDPVLSDDTVYITGGINKKSAKYSKNCYTYSLASDNDNWDSFDFPYSVCSHRSVATKGIIYIFGGMEKTKTKGVMGVPLGPYSNNLMKYDIKSRVLKSCSSMPSAPIFFSVCEIDNAFFLIYMDSFRNVCISKYSPKSDRWEKVTRSKPLVKKDWFSAAYFNHKIYFLTNADAFMLFYSFKTNSWHGLLRQENLATKFPTLVATKNSLYAMATDGAYRFNDGVFELLLNFTLDWNWRSIAT